MERIYTKHLKEILGSSERVPVINVLPQESFEKEHIFGSVNIPFEDADRFRQRIERRYPSKGQKIVVYCANEACKLSEKAGKALDEAGFSNVMEFSGGMQEWKEAGEQVESGKI